MLKVYNPEIQCPECRGTGEVEIGISTKCRDAPLWENYKRVTCCQCNGTGARGDGQL